MNQLAEWMLKILTNICNAQVYTNAYGLLYVFINTSET